MFCSEKSIKNSFVKQIMQQIDSDQSNTINAVEFFDAVVANLNMEDNNVTVADIITELRWNPHDQNKSLE